MNAPVSITSPRPLAPVRDPGYRGLKHLPGQPGWARHLPFYDTARFLRDPYASTKGNYERFGPIFRVNNFGGWHAVLLGPEANELVLLDRERNFSSEHGWGPILDRLFPRGLMLLDFDVHRVHRKALSGAFKPGPMKGYCEALNEGIRGQLESWASRGQVRAYDAIKQLTLDLAATSFLGVPWGPEADRINGAFRSMVAAAVSIIRTPLPGTLMAKGVAGRRYLSGYFQGEIARRRGRDGKDIFTQICNAEDEQGQLLTDQEIIDHMNFLMMAAHDTLTSSLTSIVYFLARDPSWQDRLRAEVLALASAGGDELAYEQLGSLPECEMAFKEALRINPPVPSLPRQALRSFEFAGYTVPAGTHIGVNPLFTHRMPHIWPDPLRFDPLRFTPEAIRERHKHAWVPFGGGAHMCIGLHFGMMQAKVFLYQLLSRYRWSVPAGYDCDFQLFPIPKPRDGLPVSVARL
jgi:cytochrome P450